MNEKMKPVEKPVAVIVRGTKKVDIIDSKKRKKDDKND